MKTIIILMCLVMTNFAALCQSVGNPGLESGTAAPWTAWNPSGTSAVVASNARTGTYAVQQTGTTTGFEQVVTGLEPSTVYTFEAWIKVGTTGQVATIGAKNYGGQDLQEDATSTSYQKVSLNFTTGANNTQVTIYMYKNAVGTAYGDDFALYKFNPTSFSNPGFEINGLTPWYTWAPAGTVSVVANNARSGQFSVQESGGEVSVEQVVTGLQPNTAYKFEGWAKVSAAGQSIKVGVKNFGGAELNSTVTETSYKKTSISFTTGASNTQATIFLYKPVAGTGYGDDFLLYKDTITSAQANTNYYINSVGGNDASNGTSPATAWKTLQKVNNTIFKEGDSVLFYYAGTWTGSLKPLGSGVAGNPIVIGKYGTTNSQLRPIINGNGAPRAVHLSNIQYVEVTNLEVINAALPGSFKRGIEVSGTETGKLTHIFIKNNYVHDVLGNNLKDGWGSAGIMAMIYKTAGAVPSWFDSVRIENNIVKTVNRTGITTNSDWSCRSDWGCSGTNNYIPHTNIVIKNNYVENAGGDGIVPINTISALVEYNMVNGANVNSGTFNAGIWAWNADSTLFQYNEAYNVKTINDGMGYDIDYGQNATIFQYNYSHDNDGGFILACRFGTGTTNSNGIVRYNVSQNDRYRVFTISGPVLNLKVYNNSIYLPAGSTTQPLVVANWGNVYPLSVQFTNNIFQLTSAGSWSRWSSISSRTFDNNIIYGAHTAGEPTGANNLSSNPMFNAPGTGTTGSLVNGIISFGNVDGYKLKSGSPAYGAGKLIVSNGGKDYWGNAVSSTTVPAIGAYNGTPVAAMQAFAAAPIKTLDMVAKNAGISSYPNPAKRGDIITTLFESVSSDKAAVQITDMEGRQVYLQTIQVVKGINKIETKIPMVSAGNYILQLCGKVGKRSVKIVVQ